MQHGSLGRGLLLPTPSSQMSCSSTIAIVRHRSSRAVVEPTARCRWVLRPDAWEGRQQQQGWNEWSRLAGGTFISKARLYVCASDWYHATPVERVSRMADWHVRRQRFYLAICHRSAPFLQTATSLL